MQCEFEAQTQIVQNYWRIIRNNVQRIIREADKTKNSGGNSTTTTTPLKESTKLQDIKEKRDFAFTMGITA